MAKTAETGGRRTIPWRTMGWSAAGLLLLAPLVAMRFTDEVNWTASDFAFAALLFGAVGLGLELAVRRTGDKVYRTAAAVALGLGFLLVWINGAVGIIGNESEAANRLYGAVLATALIGAVVARFRPAGMALAMAAAALVQVAVPLIAATMDPVARSAAQAPEVAALTAVFAALWLLAAALFRTAARS